MNQQETFEWLVERSNRLEQAQSRIAELEAEVASLRPWKDAVLSQLEDCCELTPETKADPVAALHSIVGFERQVALNPTVSAEARALRASGMTWVTDREPTEEEFKRGVVVKTCWRDGGVNMTIDVFISPPEDGYKCALDNVHAERRWLFLPKWKGEE